MAGKQEEVERGATLGTKAAPPKVTTEVERKWLVHRSAATTAFPPAALLSTRDMEQAYISVEKGGNEVRMRRTSTTWPQYPDQPPETTYVMTVKGNGGLTRQECETPITHVTYTAITRGFARDRVLEKVRKCYKVGDLVAEVDVYGGHLEPLCVVEVEFPDEAAARAWEPCAALKEHGMEVTGDARFKNQNLAQLVAQCGPLACGELGDDVLAIIYTQPKVAST